MPLPRLVLRLPVLLVQRQAAVLWCLLLLLLLLILLLPMVLLLTLLLWHGVHPVQRAGRHGVQW
jgi:hypothetical protein